MRKTLSFVLFVSILVVSVKVNGQTDAPNVASGKLVRIGNFVSKYVTSRNVDIWLPDGYSADEKYAVLYMHDGQMLYDPEKSWNKQAWNIDDAAAALISSNKIKNFIIVGIWNGGKTRHPDYFPQKPFEQMSKAEQDTVTAQLQRVGRTTEMFRPQSDQYLKFLVKELKPYIDRNYSVYTNRANTFIAGSSMGGLISMYAICEYPKVFGGAACLSTHWLGTFTPENNQVPSAFIRYLESNLPGPKHHKIYFDCGDQTLDAFYPPIQQRVDKIMLAKGYNGSNWLTKYYPGEDHSEQAWGKRLNVPLEFLLGR